MVIFIKIRLKLFIMWRSWTTLFCLQRTQNPSIVLNIAVALDTNYVTSCTRLVISRFLNLPHNSHLPSLIDPTPTAERYVNISQLFILLQILLNNLQQLYSIHQLSLHGLFIDPTSTSGVISLLYSSSYFNSLLLRPYFYLKHTMKINSSTRSIIHNNLFICP